MIVLSPAKSLREEIVPTHKTSEIRLSADSQELISALTKLDKGDLQQLMSISDNLAALNHRRYAEYEFPFHKKNTNTAIHSFTGDVYQGLDLENWTGHDYNFAQKNVRILSGLYGLLRPLDLMHPYRLEMGTKLKNKKGKNLYEFWGDKLTLLLNQDLQDHRSKFLLNLASKEYYSALQEDKISVPVYNIHFREWRKEKWSFVSFNAKRARGLMTEFVVKNRIKSLRKLKDFNLENYSFNAELTEGRDLYFTREEF